MLFKDTIKLTEYTELSKDTNFAGIRSTIRMIEEQHIVSALGNQLYSSLNNAYTLITDEVSLSAANKSLLDKCRSVIGPLVSYHLAYKKDITIGDGGSRRSETNTAKTAYQYQVTQFRQGMLDEADKATESLLKFLDENADAYPEWLSSSAFADYKNTFIKSGKEFAELFPSASPYRNFAAMRSKMIDVEETNIRAALGNSLYADLKTKDLQTTIGGAFSLKETELLKKLKKAIAYLTVAFSIPFLNVRIDAGGITVTTSNQTSDDDKSTRMAAANSALNTIMKRCEDAGAVWLKNAIKYLNDNSEDFTGWPFVNTNTESCADRHERVTKFYNQERKGNFGLL